MACHRCHSLIHSCNPDLFQELTYRKNQDSDGKFVIEFDQLIAKFKGDLEGHFDLVLDTFKNS